ncbi:MAG: VWA domain-containing protein [Polyangiaceae bacterium]
MNSISKLGRWLGLACATWAGSAQGLDSFASTRTSTLSERAHTATLTLEPGHAELVVQRSVWNSGDTSDQAVFMLELPAGAVATRLRTRGVGPAAPWYEGDLLEAGIAAARYRELTGLGAYLPKNPAWLWWQAPGRLALQVFPCAAHTEKQVEYRLELPLHYERGQFRLRLEPLGTQALSAQVRLLKKGRRDSLSVDDKPFVSGGWLRWFGTAPLEIGLSTPSDRLEVELTSQPAGERALTHAEVRAAPRLSQAPEQAYVVLLLDASRSTEADFEQSAKSALDAYLAHLPDAHVELMTFARHASAETDGFVSVEAARSTLRTLALGRLNGSDVDTALFEADRLLASAPPGHARRIVLVGDGLARQSLNAERLRAALTQSGALLHIGLLTTGEPSLFRMDEHPWAEAARATGGLVWQAMAPALDVSSDALATTYEEWARPLRIDRLGAYSDDAALTESLGLDTLAEGEGRDVLFVSNRSTHTLSVSGELWSTPIRVSAPNDTGPSTRWAALAFGTNVFEQLDPSEMMELALRGRAVSPVTSFLAIEPGVRPSRDGLDGDEVGLALGASNSSACGSVSCPAGGSAPYMDTQAYLEARLRPDYARCGGVPGSAVLDLETTRAEVVHVAARARGERAVADAKVLSCAREAAWALLLPPGFREEWAAFAVEL